MKNIKISLRILAIIFWWYIPVFILSILPLLNVSVPNFFFTEFRGVNYAWDFELMFVVIFAVWGFYLWKISNKPLENLIFIDFTIWATVFHIAAMIVIGLIRLDDLQHMVMDAIGMGIPLSFLIYSRVFLKFNSLRY